MIASHLVTTVTGRRLDGGQLTPEIQSRIEECECLVAMLTRRDLIAKGRWSSHSWVLAELGHARSKKRHAIALVEGGVEVKGADAKHEYIDLNHDLPLEAFLRLSETIGSWRQKVGRRMKVRIFPDEAVTPSADVASTKCEHKLWIDGKGSAWMQSDVVREVGGTFMYVDGVRDDHAIELRIRQSNKEWRSDVAAQWMTVHLKQIGKPK